MKAIEDLKALAAELPDNSGVYLMKNRSGDIIYIGKAVSLRKRVSSYFIRNRDTKTRFLITHIDSIDFIPTRNEYEALVLENNLIKKWKPRYNINLKDGKSYPVIKITNDEFPRIYRTRKIIQDGSDYFGPFPGTRMLDEYLDLVNRLFPLRKCRGRLKKRKTPCLYYHIGRCSAPCAGLISAADYAAQVNKVRSLLSGKTGPLLRDLRQEMRKSAAAQEFEKAARLRDTITAVETVGKEQGVEDFLEEGRDYIAFELQDELCSFCVLQMRNGKLVGRDVFSTRHAGSPEEGLLQFLSQYYSSDRLPPPRVYIQIALDSELLKAMLEASGLKLPLFHVPERGRHASILGMSAENARMDLQKRRKRLEAGSALKSLQQVLGLPLIPRTIEGFDISQLAGTHTVAAMVSFKNGAPERKNYRHYNIKSLKGRIDDFEAMREVIARRYTRVVNEGLPRPDLILIDGGKGQVSAAYGILDALGLADVPLVGLAKKEETLFLPGQFEGIKLDHSDPGLRILIHVRDEAHRFGTAFNNRHRRKDIAFSFLESIPGIGPGRSAGLLEIYGSLEAIAGAEPEEISHKTALSLDLAIKVAEKAAEYHAASPKPFEDKAD